MVVAGFVLLTHWGGGSGYNNCADNTKIVDHLAYPGKDNFGDKNAHWGSYYCWKV